MRQVARVSLVAAILTVCLVFLSSPANARKPFPIDDGGGAPSPQCSISCNSICSPQGIGCYPPFNPRYEIGCASCTCCGTYWCEDAACL